MSRHRTYDNKTRKRMRELYNSGIRSTRRIAYLLGCSHHVVWLELGDLQRHYIIKPHQPRNKRWQRFIEMWS